MTSRPEQADDGDALAPDPVEDGGAAADNEHSKTRREIVARAAAQRMLAERFACVAQLPRDGHAPLGRVLTDPLGDGGKIGFRRGSQTDPKPHGP